MTLKIPNYDVFEKIGHGGMATVYRARHQRLGRDAAIKVLNTGLNDAPDFVERFIREARIAADLNHTNIVQIYDVDQFEDITYLVMELVAGGDLQHAYPPPLADDQFVALLEQLCSALDLAHSKGYVHRDIKPSNILFRDNGELVLCDFGISRAIRSNTQLTQTGMMVGTPAYMSPEQINGFDVSAQSDLYSVGVITYLYLIGRAPYESNSQMSVAIKHLNEPVPRLPPKFETLQEFFDKALNKKPEMRFSNGAQLVSAFREGLASTVIQRKPQKDDATVARVPEEKDKSNASHKSEKENIQTENTVVKESIEKENLVKNNIVKKNIEKKNIEKKNVGKKKTVKRRILNTLMWMFVGLTFFAFLQWKLAAIFFQHVAKNNFLWGTLIVDNEEEPSTRRHKEIPLPHLQDNESESE